jgi:hypothetical protein
MDNGFVRRRLGVKDSEGNAISIAGFPHGSPSTGAELEHYGSPSIRNVNIRSASIRA